MGQFASRAFDGDPYIEIMRALPDKELSWWVQKVVWTAEGFTFLEHFTRTYPRLFMHKCQHCHGAGTVTCPHCNGYKIKRAHGHAFRLSEQTEVGKLLAKADTKECEHCGTYCPWDDEREWQEKWAKWAARLAYYDRAHAPIMNEWYEDVINEGRLDEDTQPEDDPEPSPLDNSMAANLTREVAKDKSRLKALMKRYGGHPYETGDMIPFKILDPTAPLADNLEALGYAEVYLPPELNTFAFPDLLLGGPNSPLRQFDREVATEYMIMRNLDAALQDLPKPNRFGPSAGTVSCPECRGDAWTYSWMPNLGTLLRSEPPFWQRSLARMNPYWQQYSNNPNHSQYSPYLSSSMATGPSGPEERGVGPSGQRRMGEVPRAPPLLTPAEVAAADAQVVAAHRARGAALQQLLRELPDAGPETKLAAAQLLKEEGGLWGSATPLGYGPKDPLAADPLRALDTEDLEQAAGLASRSPILGNSAATAALDAADIVNPARRAARQLRDARQLGKAETPEEQQLLSQWAASRFSSS